MQKTKKISSLATFKKPSLSGYDYFIRPCLYGICWGVTLFWSYILSSQIMTAFEIKLVDEFNVTVGIILAFFSFKAFSILKRITVSPVRNRKLSELDNLMLGFTAIGLLGFSVYKDFAPFLVHLSTSAIYILLRLYGVAIGLSNTTISKSQDDFYLNDDEIIHKDLQNRLIELLAENSTLNIGISGIWGSGKTCFLKEVNYSLRSTYSQTFIPVWVDLWGIHSSDNIVKNYFLGIEESLFQHQVILPYGDFDTLAQHLLENSNGSMTDLLKSVLTFNQENNFRNRIRDNLARTEKRIVIFLDNIERISPTELVTVLKLVNLFEGIENVQHIISYDRSQINKSLSSELVVGDARRFLEKLIEFEVMIPPLNNDFVFNKFHSAFEKLLCPYTSEQQERIRNQFTSYQLSALTKVLHTPRELKRFIVSFEFFFKSVALNVNAKDLFVILIMKLQHPEEYELLSRHINDFIKRGKEETITSDLVKRISVANSNLDELKFLVENINPYFDRPHTTEGSILTARRLWHTNLSSKYFRLDNISTLLTPNEIANLLGKLSTLPLSLLTFEEMIKVEDNWTHIHHELSEVDINKKGIAISSLIRSSINMTSNNQDYTRYFITEGLLRDMLILLPSKARHEMLLLLIDEITNTFHIPWRVLKEVYNPDEKPFISLSDHLVTKMLEFCKKPGGVEALDYHNLYAVFNSCEEKINSKFNESIKLGGDFVFRVLELAANKELRGGNVFYDFQNNLNHQIFQIMNINEFHEVIYQKKHMASPDQEKIITAFEKFYERVKLNS